VIDELAAPRILTLLSFRTGFSREESAVVAKEKRYYVYIVASRSRILYVGVTGFLMARVLQHKSGETDGFTKKYSINRLVYYESFRYVNRAIARETEIKKWRREKKVALIEADNPTWEDLAADWGKPALLTADSSRLKPVRNDKG
jgi:putative endonuclease